MTRIAVTGIAPAHWASYLINGDGSDLEPDDADKAEAFADWLTGHKWGIRDLVSCGEESFFVVRHDAAQFGVGGAMCVEYTALVEATVQ